MGKDKKKSIPQLPNVRHDTQQNSTKCDNRTAHFEKHTVAGVLKFPFT